MNSFKRCATAMALVMGAAIPAFAQESQTVILAVEGADVLYRVDIAVAAELCGLTEEQLAAITVDADTVFCTALAANTADVDFENDDRFSIFEDDDANDEAQQGDLAPTEGGDDAAEGEIGDDTGADTDTGTDTDTDTDAGADTGTDTGTDTSTDDGATDDGATDDGVTDDGSTDDGADSDAGADVDADTDAGADTDVDADTETGTDADSDADTPTDTGG